MNDTLELFRGRALKIARHYDTDHMIFADLTGLADDYAAAFNEALSDCPEDLRNHTAQLLQQKLLEASDNTMHSPKASEALVELAACLNRIPIY